MTKTEILKKIKAGLLAGTMAASLSACGPEPAQKEEKTNSTTISTEDTKEETKTTNVENITEDTKENKTEEKTENNAEIVENIITEETDEPTTKNDDNTNIVTTQNHSSYTTKNNTTTPVGTQRTQTPVTTKATAKTTQKVTTKATTTTRKTTTTTTAKPIVTTTTTTQPTTPAPTYEYKLENITQSAEVFNYFAEQMNYDIFRESDVLSYRENGEKYWNNGEKECKVALFLLNEQEKFKDGVLREVFKGYSDLDIADGVMYFCKAPNYQEACNGYVDFDDYALDKDISNYMNKIEEAWKYALDNKEYEDMETILADYYDNKYEKPSNNSAAFYYTTGVGVSFVESKYFDVCLGYTNDGFYGIQQLTEEEVRELSK